MPGNQNQGASPAQKTFGRTEQTTAQEANLDQSVKRRMRLFHGGTADDLPRMYVDFAVTDVSGVATFYLTEDATNTGADVFQTYRHIIAIVNSTTALYAVGWSRTGHTLTVTVKQVTIVAGVLDFTTPAAGISVSVNVVGSA